MWWKVPSDTKKFLFFRKDSKGVSVLWRTDWWSHALQLNWTNSSLAFNIKLSKQSSGAHQLTTQYCILRKRHKQWTTKPHSLSWRHIRCSFDSEQLTGESRLGSNLPSSAAEMVLWWEINNMWHNGRMRKRSRCYRPKDRHTSVFDPRVVAPVDDKLRLTWLARGYKRVPMGQSSLSILGLNWQKSSKHLFAV